MPGSYTSTRFVGREEAFARLATALGDAAGGRAQFLLIGGSAGVGVSRLLDESLRRLAGVAEPWTVLRANAWSGGDDEPYGSIIRAVGPTLRGFPQADLADLLGPAAVEVMLLLPDLIGRASDPFAPVPPQQATTSSERRQARTLESVLGLLGRLGERRPVVLVLEDLHRADAATRTLVTFLARISRNQRLAIIGTHQPDVVTRDDPWSADLASLATAAQPVERWTLPPLDRGELAALIEEIDGSRASASLLLLIAERSGGLPLVAEELLAARRELPQASLTGSFDDLVMARLAARSLECRRVMRLLAVAGRPLSAVELASSAEAYEANRAARLRGRSRALDMGMASWGLICWAAWPRRWSSVLSSRTMMPASPFATKRSVARLCVICCPRRVIGCMAPSQPGWAGRRSPLRGTSWPRTNCARPEARRSRRRTWLQLATPPRMS